MSNNNNYESRILFVDDEPDIAMAFKIGLEDKVDAFESSKSIINP